ncbi:DUF6328 family protein [Ornithinimicrobium panacihumi]|uniref:DUF6328 family protein n=1 Tax=Ornithinimicrobium panacihumi TaxID=2008449 RepID=UPI003F893F06
MDADDEAVRDADNLADERDTRGETPDQRMDRNFVELLQELRVLQTGTQILAGFLLTLPFQQRFADLSTYQVGLFLTAISLAFLTTILLVGPVSIHRVLFRRHRKADLVQLSHDLTRLGLITLGLTLTTVICLLYSVVVSDRAGWLAAAVAAVLFSSVWWALPLWLRRRGSMPR